MDFSSLIEESSPISGIDATWSGEVANSYISVSDADALIQVSIVDKSAWTSASDSSKAAALIEATRDIDSLQYVGSRFIYTQNLEFPRSLPGSKFPYGLTQLPTSSLTVEQSRMKKRVQMAACHQAVWILRNSGRNKHAENQAQGIRTISEGIGQAHRSVSYSASISRLSPNALTELQPYIESRRVHRG